MYFKTILILLKKDYFIYIWYIIQDLPFYWGPTGNQVCPAVLDCI